MTTPPLAYAGAGHTRNAARGALAALLTSHDFGDFKTVRSAYGDDAADWPPIDNTVPLVAPIRVDNPKDIEWGGVSGIHTRLAVISEKLTPDAFLGGQGAELTFDLAIDWLVVASGEVDDWRDPVFDAVLGQIGLILHEQMRAPNLAFISLSVGEVDLMQFDVGDQSVSSVSIPVTLMLDSNSLMG